MTVPRSKAGEIICCKCNKSTDTYIVIDDQNYCLETQCGGAKRVTGVWIKRMFAQAHPDADTGNRGTDRGWRILDLFCGAGGASMGLHRVFPDAEIVGVDIKPQKRYPFNFVEADAMAFPLEGYDFIWASPPCQAFSVMRKGRWQNRQHPDLIQPTRKRLIASGAYYVIENVPGAALVNSIMFCGTMFGLQTSFGSQLRRHRLFECSFPIILCPQCNHKKGNSVIGVYGGGQHPQGRKIQTTIGVYGHVGGSSKRDYLDFTCFSTDARREAMGIDWMTGNELSQAIPPAYSEWIGRQLKQAIKGLEA